MRGGLRVTLRSKLIGAKQLAETLRIAGPKLFRAASRKGIDEASRAVLADAKAGVPVGTGSLKKSLGRKVKSYKRKANGDGVYGVVGPRKDHSLKKIRKSEADVTAGKRKKALSGGKYRRILIVNGKEKIVDPVKYAHIVEYGRRAVQVKKAKVLSGDGTIYGRKARAVPGKPFLRQAWAKNRSASQETLAKWLRAAVKSAGRLRK